MGEVRMRSPFPFRPLKRAHKMAAFANPRLKPGATDLAPPSPAGFRWKNARRSAGVLAGWPGCVLAAEPANSQILLVTRRLREPRIRRRGRRRVSRRDASAPTANAAQSGRKRLRA